MLEEFKLTDDHEIVLCLIMLCKMTKDKDPLAYHQYLIHLKMLEKQMMKEFDNESI